MLYQLKNVLKKLKNNLVWVFSLFLVLNGGYAYSGEAVNSVDSIDSGFVVLKVIFSLFLVIGFIILIAFLTKKFFSLNVLNKKNIKVIDGVPIGAKDQLVLIQVGEEQILLAVSPGNIRNVHKLEKNVVIEEDKKEGVDFKNVLKKFSG